MAHEQMTNDKHARRVHLSWQWILFGVIVGLGIVIGSVVGVSYQEQDNRFCASCHTQPETEYWGRYERAVATKFADDLASFHYRKKEVRCIDCHIGEGVDGRTQVVAMAGWNAFKHFTRLEQQPAKIILPLQNEACVKCHDAELHKAGFENHVHNKYFDVNENPPFIRCTDCHLMHRLGDERTRFQFRDAILPKCEYCHVQMGKGPRGLVR
jgi:nitrate/TMAO reductase-like tetraheme cytochrome c subunit